MRLPHARLCLAGFTRWGSFLVRGDFTPYTRPLLAFVSRLSGTESTTKLLGLMGGFSPVDEVLDRRGVVTTTQLPSFT